MKRHYAMGVALTALVLIGLKLGPTGSVWSTGVLARAHANARCDDCHDAFRSFESAAKCVRCHESRRLLPSISFSGDACARCHPDHLGEDDRLSAPVDSCAPCHEPTMVPLGPYTAGDGTKTARSFHPYHDLRGANRSGLKPAAPTASVSSRASTSAEPPRLPCVGCHRVVQPAHVGKVDAGSLDDCLACHLGVHGPDPAIGPPPRRR